MSSRLSVLFDGKLVYLYEFIEGSYEDKRQFLCVHPENLSRREIYERIRGVTAQLPEKIDCDYSAPPEPDLFEQALVLVGFVVVNEDVPIGMLIKGSDHFTERDYLEECLDLAGERVNRTW